MVTLQRHNAGNMLADDQRMDVVGTFAAFHGVQISHLAEDGAYAC